MTGTMGGVQVSERARWMVMDQTRGTMDINAAILSI